MTLLFSLFLLSIPHHLTSVLGKGRFMKTLKCFNDEGPLVVKVFVKSSEDERAAIEMYKTQLQRTTGSEHSDFTMADQ